MTQETRRKSGISKANVLKNYAADTESINKFNTMQDQQSIDSRFQIPNNFTPARVNKGFIDSKQYPLISGGDPKNSDLDNNYIGKRNYPFNFDKSSINAFGFGKKKKNFQSLMSKSNFSGISGKNSKNENELNQTKFSKEQMMDIYLEDASESRMSGSRFKIDTEKED